ncbi:MULTISPECIES: mandelate racemase/muconate lactonizing enzyme family protein [Ramlibacter]|uniref:Mandelate racemase/muconate lactonizing enzyme family protein n=1 Tax=Ramlibacter pinisoli TaxID=2682844 RepID=A0A6N8IWW1_9BURK|nr:MULTISPECIES: mandelate racemase/muconate lactonizing enzyme family protein [Ramlibacter]MBA2961373.1 mandelate racemase/muconate lactonizing enzyme family protein [Ramlibacter sp. CGMCC 1.13660]MVQ31317.1 mandelate racemase/muconate lactonizing enzyme family protein [Ramlibacter pinisoli]
MTTSTAIASVACLQVRLPFDHGGPAPLFAGKPRTTLDSAWIRVELANGLVGWGESYGADLDAMSSIFRNRVAPLAAGRDALDPALTATLDRTLHNMGRSGPVTHALSGLDIALWDLRGKLAGVPVYRLLGGARRTRIPAYASLLQYYGDTALVARNVEQSLAAGYGQIKLHEKTLDSVRAARAAMGPGVPLMLDTNCAWDRQGAIAAVTAMREHDLHWVEEPVWPPEDVPSLRAVREATGVPTAVGENASSLFELLDLVRSRSADHVQPSALKSGGLTTLKAVSDACAGTPVRHSPQSAFFGPGFLATLHVLAAQEQEVAVERLFCGLGHVPYAHSVPFEGGAFHLNDQPGLGADPEPDLLAGPFVS